MFTGIIEEVGTVQTVKRGSRSSQITIRALKVTADLQIGDSISVNGVCLTVISFDLRQFTADVMPETMNRTNLGQLSADTPVNLERALRLGDRLGGHLVSGHVDGTGRIEDCRKDENAYWFRISAGKEIIRYVVEKGSVAIDGISLTVAGVTGSSFTVSVIPHTRAQTTMTPDRRGETVNIECDIISKYIEKFIKNGRDEGNITLDFLAGKGFIER
ncbi:MAG TPA: riboflavin synthase [Bacteroidales bacterium]|nr:riboflavin synthase [Bacteroidales bacterium]HPS73652.1 riboflavin synthase [Bacteroidales bacterium]